MNIMKLLLIKIRFNHVVSGAVNMFGEKRQVNVNIQTNTYAPIYVSVCTYMQT